MVHWKVKIGLVKGYMKRTAGAGALVSVGTRSFGGQDVSVSEEIFLRRANFPNF